MATHRVDAVEGLLAPDVVFHSPVVHHPYQGRDHLMPVLHAVAGVLEDLTYGATYDGADGGRVLAFSARVGDRILEGVDIVALNDHGLISELTVMVRPLSALTVLRECMANQLGGT